MMKLYSDGIIERNERDDLLSRKQAGFSDQELAERLLPMIDRKSPEKQEEFIRLVRVRQPHLVNTIDPPETDGIRQPEVTKRPANPRLPRDRPRDAKQGGPCLWFSIF